MGEFIAWGLGLGFGYMVGNSLSTPRPILLFALVILLLGTLVTLASGEIWQEPWLVIVDVGQVAIAALIGAFGLPSALRWMRNGARSEMN
jgi:hypothetical protein